MLSFLTILKNELLSYFVPEKMEYKITGKCLKCGKCCRYMYSFDTYTTTDFKIMQFLFPAYKRFYIRGKDEAGNLIFACKYVTEEGLCSVYDNVCVCAAIILQKKFLIRENFMKAADTKLKIRVLKNT